MRPLKEKLEEIIIDRPEPFFRIQRLDEYQKIKGFEKYINSGQIEVRFIDIYGRRILNKVGAESRKLICEHMVEPNKGYPEGFTDYLSYDERFEKNIKRRFEL